MKRCIYLQSVAAMALLVASGTAHAQVSSVSGDISPFSGDIDPFSGDIDPFSGDISPFRGDIDPFYGDISPFWGDISPFWGDINPFSGDIDPFSGDISPFWGDIDPFAGDISPFQGGVAEIGAYWEQIGPQWGNINTAWSALGAYGNSSQSQYNAVLNDFVSLVNTTRTTWGNAVQTATGQSIDQALLNPLLAEYGIDLNDASSLEGLSGAARSEFFLKFYDGLMGYSGTDQVDHWMATVNWTPTLTQDQGEGHDAVVGLLDVRISTTDDNVQYLQNIGGYNFSPNNHGAAVASLIAGRHDGQGVMGIAPRATVKAYSPFDSSGSSNWKDIEDGVDALTAQGANVINMSLGIPQWMFHQNMANIFRRDSLQQHAENTVYVIASGNEGIVQTHDVNWKEGATTENILFVGSVDPNKNISFFSNTPGEACLKIKGKCSEQDKLKYRFLVAPGELILVSDNNGGTTRMSGTSFAAPIVTGAISLLHDRWPWLQNFAKETTDIILETAEDLGAPGVDGVYGHGLLDVEAAQSPISFDTLQFYQPNSSGGFTISSASSFRNTIMTSGQLGLWEASGASVFAMEQVGRTYRDFSIPLSTLLAGQSGTFNGNTEQYQRHIYNRLVDWAQGSNSFVAEPYEAKVGNFGEWGVTMRAAPVSQFAPSQQQDRPFNTSFLIQTKNRKVTFQVGEGAGAVALTHTEGFNDYSSYDPSQGGVNPFLGFASGGMFANVVSELKPGLKLAFGFSNRSDDHTFADPDTGERLSDFNTLSDYQANAITADVAYSLSKNFRFNVTLTHLEEETGVLGAQGSGLLSLDQGATTNSVTVGANYRLSPRFSLSASASAGRTHSNGFSNSLGVAEDGLTSTAFEFAATAKSLLKDNDRLRLSFAQPLNIENGALQYQSVQVVNRATGELGVVNEFWELGSGSRHYITEAQYGFPLLEGAAEVSLFGRMDFGGVDIDGEFNSFAAGSRFTLEF